MLKKIIIAAVMIIIITAATGDAEMAGVMPENGPGAVNYGITEISAGINIAAEIENEKAEVIKQKEAKEEAERETAKEKEQDPREIFLKFFPTEDYDQTVNVLAKVLRGEAGGVKSDTNKACVIWCILNRVDKKMRGETIIKCATSDSQFNYHTRTHVVESFRNIAEDVLNRWLLEKTGVKDVGRVLPENYCFFYGNGRYNVFRNQYHIHGSKRVMPVHSRVYGD